MPIETPKESTNGIPSITDSPNEVFYTYSTSPDHSFAFIEANIIATSLSITALGSVDTLLNHKLSKFVGHWAELIGGVVVTGNSYTVLAEQTFFQSVLAI